ncbi:hypothetical protein ACFE04_011065 [Oxalis oulophora]
MGNQKQDIYTNGVMIFSTSSYGNPQGFDCCYVKRCGARPVYTVYCEKQKKWKMSICSLMSSLFDSLSFLPQDYDTTHLDSQESQHNMSDKMLLINQASLASGFEDHYPSVLVCTLLFSILFTGFLFIKWFSRG